jgi:hypothetical protein
MKKGIDSLRFTITGVSPFIMHSGRLADPLDPASEAIKKVPVGKKATRADMKLRSELEFIGGLYLDGKRRIIIPADNLMAVLIAGAKRDKRGKDFAAGVYVDQNATLDYWATAEDGSRIAGPTDPQKLCKDQRFVLRIPVKQGTSRIIRTRAIFPHWTATFDVEFDPLQVDRKAVVAALAIAGERIGLGDWRPRFGRFDTKEVVEQKMKKAA